MATLAQVAHEIYPCRHITEEGLDAFTPVGIYGEGYEQCILCGEVICTVEQDQPEMFRENVPAY